MERDPDGNLWAVVHDYAGETPVDFRVERYDIDGVFLSSRALADATGDGKYGIALDGSGNAWIAGTRVSGGGAPELAVWKVAPDGNTLVGSTTFVEAVDRAALSGGIAVDGSGAVWVAGGVQTTAGDTYKAALWKFDSAGTLQPNFPKYQERGGTFDFGAGIGIDAAGAVWSAGMSRDPADGSLDLALWKYDAAGSLLGDFPAYWNDMRPAGFPFDAHEAFDGNLAMDPAGRVWVAASRQQAAPCEVPDFALARYDLSGNQQTVSYWHGAGGTDSGSGAMALTSTGEVVVAGFSGETSALWRYAADGSLLPGYPRTRALGFSEGAVTVDDADIPWVVSQSSPLAFTDGTFLAGAEGPSVCGTPGLVSLSGIITYEAGFSPGQQVTIAAAQDYYGEGEAETTVGAAAGNTVTYTLQVDAPGSYYLDAVFGLPDDEIPNRPVGAYNAFAPVAVAGNLSGLDITITADAQAPLSAITYPVHGSTIAALSFVEGTASDNFALDGVELAVEDLTAGRWWTAEGRWVATPPDPIYQFSQIALAGPPGAPAWQVDARINETGPAPLGGISGFLINGNTYRIHSLALDNADNEQATAATADFTWDGPTGDIYPPPPQTITGAALSAAVIDWTWDTVDDATSYVLTLPGGTPIATVNDTAYLQEGLSTNSAQQICVAAANQYGAGEPLCSEQTFTLAAVPGAPVLSDVGPNSLTATWDAGGNPQATGYQVGISVDDFATEIVAVPLTSRLFANTTTLTLLDPDTVYSVRVQAYNGDDILSVYSTVASTKTKLAGPDAPTDTTATVIPQTGEVSLSWNAAATGTPAEAFNVERASVPGNYQFRVVGTTSTAAVDQPGISGVYFYRFSGINSDGIAGSPSAPIEVLFDGTPPERITDLAVAAVRLAQNEADLTWTAPTDDFSGVASYEVRSSSSFQLGDWNFDKGRLELHSITPGSPGTTETLTVSISTGETRWFGVRAYDVIGNYAQVSNPAAVDLTPPNIVYLGIQEGGVVQRTYNYTAQASDDVGIARVEVEIDGVSRAVSEPGDSHVSFLLDTRELADGEHSQTVIAEDTSGNVATLGGTFIVNYTPPGVPSISEPETDFVTEISTINVSGLAEAGTTVQLMINGLLAASVFVPGVPPDLGSFQFESIPLANEGSNIVTARASDAKGASPNTASVQVLLFLGPPEPPFDLEANSISGGRIELTWVILSTDTTTDSFAVYRSTDEALLVAGAPSIESLLISSGVRSLPYIDAPSEENVYFYGVTAVDLIGNESELSNIAAEVSDGLPPFATFYLETAVPPIGPGQYPAILEVSELLAGFPLLTFSPPGESPLAVNLSPVSAGVWKGTISVTASMSDGAAQMSFQGIDLVGNTGTTISSGSTLALDTHGPIGAVTLSKPSPVGPGALDVTLTHDEPVAGAPSLFFTPEGGQPVSIAMVQSTASPNATIFLGQIVISTDTGEGTADFAYSATDSAGNTGTSLLGGATFFVIDTIAPSTPRFLYSRSEKGGVVLLTWSAPVTGPPSRYYVYRNGMKLSGGVAPIPDGSGAFTDGPLSDGEYQYVVSAADLADNESPLSDPPVIGIADSIAPGVPSGLQASSDVFGNIQLEWTPDGAETPAGYNLYRATTSIASLAGITPKNTLLNLYTDVPLMDATYYYRVTALDGSGNESDPSSQSSVLFDRAAPVISVVGIEDDALINTDAVIHFSASDANLDPTSLQAALDGQPFVSGSTVGAAGVHELSVSASDNEGHPSLLTLSFTIDKTSPAVAVTGVWEGGVYQSPVAAHIVVSDLNLSATNYTLTNVTLGSTVPYSSDDPIARNGPHILWVEAYDAAGNTSTYTAAFTLQLGPLAPADPVVRVQDEAGAFLSWSQPEPDVVAYRVYRDGRLISTGVLRETTFHDTSLIPGASYQYEIVALDHNGMEGERARITVHPVSLELAGYGMVRNNLQSLTRGFFDSVRLSVTNRSTQTLPMGPAALEIVSGDATIQGVPSETPSLSPGAQTVLTGVVSTPPDLPDSVSLRVSLPVPSESGTTVQIAKTLTLAVADPEEPTLEIFAGAMVPGTNGSVQAKLHNRGSAALDILTAQVSMSTYAAVDDITVKLHTPEGTLLSQGGILQTGNGAAGLLVGGKQYFFMSIPAGSAFVFDPINVPVPEAAGTSVRVSAQVSTPSYRLPSSPLLGSRDFISISTQVVVSAIPYAATVAVDSAYYDQGSTVTLTGTAQSLSGDLLPATTVSIYILSNGFKRHISTVTDENGAYTTAFYPPSHEAGVYQVTAAHPDIVTQTPQAGFTIVGFGFGEGYVKAGIAQNSSLPFIVGLNNIGETSVGGLTSEVLNPESVPGLSLTLDPTSLPDSLAAGAQAVLKLTASVDISAPLGEAELVLVVTESNGFSRKLRVILNVSPSFAIPNADPQAFEMGILGGETRTQAITLKNLGFDDWLSVRLTTPSLDWVSIEGLRDLGDIPPGGNANVTLRFQPPAGLSAAYAENPLLEIVSLNASTVPINAAIVVTSSKKGGLAFRLINADIQRDASGNGSLVAGTTVTLRSLSVPGMVFKVYGAANGIAEFADIPTGDYQWTAQAAGFQPKSDTVTIEPGLSKFQEIVLVTAAVTYEWSVTPTEIQDKYDITLAMTFATDVNVPKVVFEPTSISLNMESHVPVYGEFKLTNYGNVSAFDVVMEPESPDGEVNIELPFYKIPEIKAQQSVVVPYRITHGAGVTPGLPHCHPPIRILAECAYNCKAGPRVKQTIPPMYAETGSGNKCDGPSEIRVKPGKGGGVFVNVATGGWGGISAVIGKIVSLLSCKKKEPCQKVSEDELTRVIPEGIERKQVCVWQCPKRGTVPNSGPWGFPFAPPCPTVYDY